VSEAPIDPGLATTYYLYVLVFFAAVLALSALKHLAKKGGSGEGAIR